MTPAELKQFEAILDRMRAYAANDDSGYVIDGWADELAAVLAALPAAGQSSEPNHKEALRQICERIERGVGPEAETYREVSAARGRIMRDAYAIAETALMSPESAPAGHETPPQAAPAIVEGYDATFWNGSYLMLREAIVTHLDAFIQDDDVAEECILVAAVEKAGEALAAPAPPSGVQSTGICSAHRDGEDRTCPICYPSLSEVSRLREAAKVALAEMCNTVAPRETFTDAVDALDSALAALSPAKKDLPPPDPPQALERGIDEMVEAWRKIEPCDSHSNADNEFMIATMKVRELLRELALASPPVGWQGLRDLVVKWRQHAWDLNEEGRRIQRTIKQSTGAEDRCYARAEVWVKCADELEAALPASPETQP